MFLNVIVLTYAKIATLKGFDLNIDHPTAPKELIVYAPLKEYKDPYDFMQDYSFDSFVRNIMDESCPCQSGKT